MDNSEIYRKIKNYMGWNKMTRKVQKADKLVNSATSIFGKALAKVMKANDLINAHIETQLSLNDQDQAKI